MECSERMEEKLELFKNAIKIVTFDIQLHQAVLYDITNTMKEIIHNIISPAITYGKNERLALIPIAQQFCNHLHETAVKLKDGFHYNHFTLPASITNHNTASNILTEPRSNVPISANLQIHGTFQRRIKLV